MIEVCTPFTADQADRLRAGDSVLFTGTLYTARGRRPCKALSGTG